jgi:GAF domain-containing protein
VSDLPSDPPTGPRTAPSSTAADLLDELGRLATELGPAVRPVGADRLLASITESARRLFGASACSLALLTDDGAELVYTTASGEGAQDVTGMRLPAGTGVAGWVVQSGEAVVVSDPASDPRFARDVAAGTGYVPRELLAVPVGGEQVLGVLTLLDRDPARPGAASDMSLLSVFADQAALTLQNERAFGDLGRVLLSALARAAEEGSPLADVLGRAAAGSRTRDGDLAELAAVVAALDRQSAEDRRLAVRLVREVAEHTRRRSARRGR